VRGKKRYSWDLAQAAVVLGINYVGLFDDLAVFSRALSPEEVAALGHLDGGVRSLYGAKVSSAEGHAGTASEASRSRVGRSLSPEPVTRWQSPYRKRTVDRARAIDPFERPH